jgi:hypothetical protein
MSDFAAIARPVIFEDSNSDYPYWGKGTSFIIANDENYFWITASHVMKNMGGNPENLRVFPSDASRKSLPFNELYTIHTEDLDSDYKDVYVLRIALAEFQKNGDAPLAAQDMTCGFMSPEALSLDDVLYIVGYPSESSVIDFDSQFIRETRTVLRALYRGESVSAHCHTAQVVSDPNLNSYDGLSGSPVFYLEPQSIDSRKVLYPRIVGMLLRGTASSATVHFVSVQVIQRLIELVSKDG